MIYSSSTCFLGWVCTIIQHAIYIYIYYIYKVSLRDVGGMKSEGCRKLKRETHVKLLHLFFESENDLGVN